MGSYLWQLQVLETPDPRDGFLPVTAAGAGDLRSNRWALTCDSYRCWRPQIQQMGSYWGCLVRLGSRSTDVQCRPDWGRIPWTVAGNLWEIMINLILQWSRWSTPRLTSDCCTGCGHIAIHASKCSIIIRNQLKFVCNSPFKDSISHPIHTCFPIISSNVVLFVWKSSKDQKILWPSFHIVNTGRERLIRSSALF